jgi:glycosyltransferase involved in cell wall biosynthesis
MRQQRLIILSTHPIQYHSPWFRVLANHPEIDLEVWFCHKATPTEQAAAGFGVEFDWDRSLLDGYSHRFLRNVASNPGVNSYAGLDTPELQELIRSEKPDALIVNGWHYKSAWQAMRACWRESVPVMARSDSNLRTRRNAAKRALKWPYYRWFIPKLDACLAVGTWSRDYFLHYGARAESIFTVPHVVDAEYFQSEVERLRSKRDEVRAKWNLRRESVVFLFAGKFIAKKRPMEFVKAVELAAKENNFIAGLMVGDGPLRQSCEEYVSTNHLPLRFTGFLNQSEIVRAYVAADALVLPSDGGETWGLVVNEAMTCGLPCFVSDHVGCSSDMIVAKQTGAVFPLGDYQRLANCLTEFAGDDIQRKTMSKRAKERVSSYSSTTALAGTLEALDSLKAIRYRK